MIERIVFLFGAEIIMTKIKDSQGFLPEKRISILPDTTPLKDALSELSGDISGFVLASSSDPAHFRGYVPGSQVFNLVKSGKWKKLNEQSLLALVENPAVEVTMTPMAEGVLQTNDENVSESVRSKITRVIDPAGDTSGYFIADRFMGVQIPPRVLFCSNPNASHPNSQAGRCRSCPFPVAG